LFWSLLGDEDRAALSRAGVTRSYQQGAFVFFEGDPPSHVLIIESGALKLELATQKGRGVLLELRTPGDLVGEFGVFDEQSRSAAATAIEHLTVLQIPTARFRELLMERPSICFAVASAMTTKLRETTRRRLESGTADTLSRVVNRLVELAADRRPDGDGVIVIDSSLTQHELAEWIGASRDAVVLAMTRLRQLGWIETGRRQVRILDPDALRRFAAT
jgi:CRP-like cAMP-binding protein